MWIILGPSLPEYLLDLLFPFPAKRLSHICADVPSGRSRSGTPITKCPGVRALTSDGSGDRCVKSLEVKQASICHNRLDNSSKFRKLVLHNLSRKHHDRAAAIEDT
ncbi:hypothetical protein TNIN_364641 [Trichonephila inaurata madagascariensis]|uniref:Uncharacterized protein n=1 Tax=Trichonephila inaurata madagascariensis TaxID=2747483 RepID=A0A8X6MCB8_9ARAC|nr:hypothetical protein TNIN_364641 [Trichonephila inaurata madagascariensis]